jgi:segregation and condensation protein B
MERLAVIEAILFVAEEPIPASEIAEVLEMPRKQIEEDLHELQASLDARGAGIELRKVAGGWRLYTRPELRPYLERYAASDRVTRLSPAALETLSVVAYKQPVSRGQVSEIRGVDSERALRTLERRGLVADIGRAEGSGQAVLFGTTPLFLEKLGVDSLADLPPLADHVPPAQVVDALERPFRPEGPSNESTS